MPGIGKEYMQLKSLKSAKECILARTLSWVGSMGYKGEPTRSLHPGGVNMYRGLVVSVQLHSVKVSGDFCLLWPSRIHICAWRKSNARKETTPRCQDSADGLF